jgi:hypothetical protein
MHWTENFSSRQVGPVCALDDGDAFRSEYAISSRSAGAAQPAPETTSTIDTLRRVQVKRE